MNIRIDLPRPTFRTPPPLTNTLDDRQDYDAVLYDCPDCDRLHFVTVGECPTDEQALREQRLAGL